MVTEVFTASRGVVGLPTLGAFSHVSGELRPRGVGVITVGTGAPAGASTGVASTVVASTGVASTVVASTVVANAVVAAGVPAANVREHVNAAPFSTPSALGQATVRKQNTYMTRFIANGGDAPGPHRWRVPV